MATKVCMSPSTSCFKVARVERNCIQVLSCTALCRVPRPSFHSRHTWWRTIHHLLGPHQCTMHFAGAIRHLPQVHIQQPSQHTKHHGLHTTTAPQQAVNTPRPLSHNQNPKHHTLHQTTMHHDPQSSVILNAKCTMVVRTMVVRIAPTY